MHYSHLNDNFEFYSEKRFIRSITVTMLFTYFQIAFLNAYVVVYLKTDLLTSIFIISVIVSLRNVLQLLFRIPLGELSQQIGRKPLIVLGNLSFTLALLFTFLATDWILVLVAIIFLGFGMSSYWPACFSYIGDVSDERYGQNNGKMFQGMDIGLIISSLLAVVLLDVVQIELKLIFGLFFIFGLIFFLFIVKYYQRRSK
jgi:MFS family permease